MAFIKDFSGENHRYRLRKLKHLNLPQITF